jgi:hypothetical protein
MTQRLLSLRNTRSGSVMDLFDLGLSFRLMLAWGLLPPLETMNDFLACGRDDTDAEEGLLQWEPFALTSAEYNRLVRDLSRRGHEVLIDTVPAERSAPSYQKWFASRLAEPSTKRRIGRKPRRS